MNAKIAKRIRKDAAELTAGNPQVAYAVANRAIIVHPETARGKGKTLKRMVKDGEYMPREGKKCGL